jgi:hypothetical protein
VSSTTSRRRPLRQALEECRVPSSSLMLGTRRECAPVAKGSFCNIGTMRKLAVLETSFRSAAVTTPRRTADLSCAEGAFDASEPSTTDPGAPGVSQESGGCKHQSSRHPVGGRAAGIGHRGVTIRGSAAGTDVGHRPGLIAEPMATAARRQTQWSVSGRWRRVGAAARMPRPTARPKISSVTFGLRYRRTIPRPSTGSERAM